MKLVLTLTISTLLISCGMTSPQNEQANRPDDNWELTNHTFTTNTYTSTGLLDSSYKTMLVYQTGILIDTIKSIVARKYNNDKLAIEREFAIEKDGSNTLLNETIKQYDANGNVTSEVHMMDSNMLSKTVNEYNDKEQVVKSIQFFQKMNDNLNDYILDSAVAHRNDKKHFQYDTLIITREYDANGNQIRTAVYDTKEKIQETTITQYSGSEKTFSFSLTPQGDTIATLIFSRDGKLIRQIANVKEMNAVDTIWLENGKIVKAIGYNGKIKYKDVTSYNDKGDEIESASYK